MFKAYSFPTLIAVAFSTACTTGLGAWAQKSPMHQEAPPPDTRFPLNPHQAWAMEESLLVWKTYEDDTDYALHRFLDLTNASLLKEKNSIKHPTFDWSTGVRLKLTRYLPSNDPWDINVIAMYYYDRGDQEVEVDFSPPNSTTRVNTLQSTWIDVGSASEARASSQMNFFTFDLTAGRYYELTKKTEIHPFIGIRSVLNYQTYKASYSSTVTNSPPFLPTKFKGEFDFWGIGPRIGTDVILRMSRHWSLLGTFGASLFAGRSDIDERFVGQTDALPLSSSLYNEKLQDKDGVLRSNIDASLGLGWEKWVRGKTVRIAPSFVFEVSEWFSMKRWIDNRLAVNGEDTPFVRTHRRYSDLGLMGFNINLQVDF